MAKSKYALVRSADLVSKKVGHFLVVEVCHDYAYVRDHKAVPGVPTPVHRIVTAAAAVGNKTPFETALEWAKGAK